MQIHFLGTGGYHPNEQRHTACYLLPEAGVLFDAGTGCFRVPPRLQSTDIQVFLSHAHLDHIIGLTYLLVPMVLGTIKRARIYGTEQTLNAVRNHLFAEHTFPVLPDFDFVAIDDREQIEVPGGTVTHHPLPSHPGGSTAYRLTTDEQKSLAYVTDTTVDGSYTEFIRGVDLLIHECNFPDSLAEWSAKTGHSHLGQVLELARDAQVGRLVLVHPDPDLPDAHPIDLTDVQAVFAATEMATDLQVMEF